MATLDELWNQTAPASPPSAPQARTAPDGDKPAPNQRSLDEIWQQTEAQPRKGLKAFWEDVTGQHGPRLQLFPERMVRGMLGAAAEGPKLMKDVYEGKVNPASKEAAGRAMEAASVFSPIAPQRAGIAAAAKQVVPTAEQLFKHSQAGYEALKNSDTAISGTAINSVYDAIAKALEGEHWYGDINAPQTFKMLGKMRRGENAANDAITIGELKGIQESLGKVGGEPTDQAAAAYADKLFDKYLSQVPASHVVSGDPVRDSAVLRNAASSYRGYKRSEALVGEVAGKGGVLERAERQAGRSGAGWNFGNTLRQRIDAILNSPKERARYDQQELDALAKIVKGTRLQNTARQIGKAAPTGVVSSVPLLLTALAGQAPLAGAIGLTGLFAKGTEEAIARRAVRKVAESIRGKTPLAQTGKSQIVRPRQTTAIVPPVAVGDALAPPQDALGP